MVTILTPDEFDKLDNELDYDYRAEFHDVIDKMKLIYRKLYKDTENFRSEYWDVEQFYKDNEKEEL